MSADKAYREDRLVMDSRQDLVDEIERLKSSNGELLAFAKEFMRRWNQEEGSKPVSVLRPMALAAIAKAES